MPSKSLDLWRTTRSDTLDEIVAAHRSVGGQDRGRRFATQQINCAYTKLLSSQFQGFCRDLHSECGLFCAGSTQFAYENHRPQPHGPRPETRRRKSVAIEHRIGFCSVRCCVLGRNQESRSAERNTARPARTTQQLKKRDRAPRFRPRVARRFHEIETLTSERVATSLRSPCRQLRRRDAHVFAFRNERIALVRRWP